MRSFCPVWMPKTRGRYSHPCWSISFAASGAGYDAPSGSPLFTYTNTFPSAPLLTTYCESTAAVAYFFAHSGSSAMSMVGLAGGVPAKWMVPETVASPVGPLAAPAAGVPAAEPPASPDAAAPESDFCPEHAVDRARRLQSARLIVIPLVQVSRPYARGAGRARRAASRDRR